MWDNLFFSLELWDCMRIIICNETNKGINQMNTRDTIKAALKGRIMTMVFTKKNGDIRKAYGQIVENDQRPSDEYPNLITFVDFSVGGVRSADLSNGDWIIKSGNTVMRKG